MHDPFVPRRIDERSEIVDSEIYLANLTVKQHRELRDFLFKELGLESNFAIFGVKDPTFNFDFFTLHPRINREIDPQAPLGVAACVHLKKKGCKKFFKNAKALYIYPDMDKNTIWWPTDVLRVVIFRRT